MDIRSMLYTMLLLAAHEQLAKWSTSDKFGGSLGYIMPILDEALTKATVSHLAVNPLQGLQAAVEAPAAAPAPAPVKVN
jgi:hypothetical protein